MTANVEALIRAQTMQPLIRNRYVNLARAGACMFSDKAAGRLLLTLVDALERLVDGRHSAPSLVVREVAA